MSGRSGVISRADRTRGRTELPSLDRLQEDPRAWWRQKGERAAPWGAAVALAVLGLGAWLPGCDNPACVFGGGCNGSGEDPLGENPATIPEDDEWIETGAPRIIDHFPAQGSPVDTHTPVVIVFSESLRPDDSGGLPTSGLAEAFALRAPSGGGTLFANGALVGNGRVLVLFPQNELQAGTTYTITMAEAAVLSDRTGQKVTRPTDGEIGTFSTATNPATVPKLIGSWPRDLATNQGDRAEIAVFFDRNINSGTVNASSFAVSVTPPPAQFDPDVSVLRLGDNDSEPRVFLWRNLDSQGQPAALGQDALVEVTLSPADHKIVDLGGGELEERPFEFRTAPFSAPISAAITSEPSDAIGVADISGPADLAIQVSLAGAQSGDFAVLTMFGTDPDDPTDPPLFALQREMALTAPFDTFTWTAQEIDLLRNSSPVEGRFEDGEVAFAFQVRRDSTLSPVRLLDVDPAEGGVQHPILDTTLPLILGLGPSGGTLSSLRSDVRDVCLVGRASERILLAGVTTLLGNNEITPGIVPPVVGSDPSGLFVAAPVRLGVLAASEQQLDYTLTVYDRAQNSAVAASSPNISTDGFRQVGASGPGTALPGGNVFVEVFEAGSLTPLEGARVHVHQILGGVISAVTASPGITDALGLATVPAAPTRTTMITVDMAGYDLFTFQGVPTSRLSVPLTREGLSTASATGSVGPLDQGGAADLNSLARYVSDSRRTEFAPAFSSVSFCNVGSNPPDYECPYGPLTIVPLRIGAQTAVTTLLPEPTYNTFLAGTFLKTAAIALPRSAVPPGADEVSTIPVEFILDDGGLDPEELPIDVAEHTLFTTDWPGLTAAPVISVEATSPGIPGALTVGRGMVFDDQPPDTWHVLAAYPGSVDATANSYPGDLIGRLVVEGTIDGDLLLAAEVTDAAGNHGRARPRFSLSSGFLAPPPPPILPSNPISVNPGQGFDLTFPDVLPDAVSAPGNGLYRLRLTDSSGRSWTFLLPDPEDVSGPDVRVHLPELGTAFPLVPGDVDCRISAWSWPTFDFSEFLWSDIEREHDLAVYTAVQTFTLP